MGGMNRQISWIHSVYHYTIMMMMMMMMMTALLIYVDYVFSPQFTGRTSGATYIVYLLTFYLASSVLTDWNWKERFRNDRFCAAWDVRKTSTKSIN